LTPESKQRIVRIEFRKPSALPVALAEIFVVVEVALVAGHAVKRAHVYGLGAFLVGQQGLVHFFAVSYAYRLYFDPPGRIEQLQNRAGKRFYCAGRSLLDEYVALPAVFKREQHKGNRLVKRHDEARHFRVRYRYGLARLYLLSPQRDDAAAEQSTLRTRAAYPRPVGADGSRL
jgi:hypothetical protein